MRPNTTQEAALLTVFKASHRLYNGALAEWKTHFEATGQYLSLYEQDKHYNKTTYPDVPAVVTDQVMKRLHRALTAYFKGRKEGRAVGFPRYKPLQRWHSIEFRNGPNTLDRCYFAEARRQVEAVPPHYTSQRCSRCGEYVQKSLSVRTHLCPHCGFVADRDVNAAINILQARTGPSRSTA